MDKPVHLPPWHPVRSARKCPEQERFLGLSHQVMVRPIVLVAVLFVLGCSKVSENPESIAESYGLPAYPHSEHLCGKRVYVSGSVPRHLTWDAFVSDSPPSRVIEHFVLELGEEGFSGGREVGTWRFPANAEVPSRVLDIFPVGQHGPHMECERAIPAGSRSVLIYSRIA
jgi:hypothetical protein